MLPWFGSTPQENALRVRELVARGAKVGTDFRTLSASILAHNLAHHPRPPHECDLSADQSCERHPEATSVAPRGRVPSS